jgi:DNA integrity scanning protein DisA with diadenylate cyclase activity
MLYRHGDVLVAATDVIPADAKLQPHLTLAHGEVTGHRHRVAETDAAELYEWMGQLFLRVVAAQATLVHEEHNAITLPTGNYKVWMQREYTPAEIRRVYD